MSEALIDALRQAVGRRQVLTSPRRTERFRSSFRGAEGEAAAVVRPGTLLELWRVLEASVAHGAVVIMQAAGTSLTDGSTPAPGGYDRPVVIVNTLRIADIRLLRGGAQVVSFPGGTLYRLEDLLRPLGREPHSVIGSSCIGASIVGGVCNNSGGSLVRRGPAYTELALYAEIDGGGRLRLVNHLGIRLGDTAEEMLRRLQRGDFNDDDIEDGGGPASDGDYASRVRQINEPSASRYNADPTLLHEASGCGGKLAVFAARLDTFRSAGPEQVFYAGTNDPAVLTGLRRAILGEMSSLPIAGEYMHRDLFDMTRRYGKDTFVIIHHLGTGVMPAFFALKGRVDGWLHRLGFLPHKFSEHLLQSLMSLWPEVLPKRLLDYRDRFAHHLMLRVAGDGVAEMEALLARTFATGEGAYFKATADEGKRAFLHRFAAAGATARYALVKGQELLPLDIALRRNDRDWFETLPPEIEADLDHKLYYGHFLCHVFHQDYVLKRGADGHAVKARMLALLRDRGAEYPAEHNVGHLYEAPPAQRSFFRALDPTNSFNPGIGKDSRRRDYA
ncbi:MAG: D-lactate dehydrogenase [Devosia sp.]